MFQIMHGTQVNSNEKVKVTIELPTGEKQELEVVNIIGSVTSDYNYNADLTHLQSILAGQMTQGMLMSQITSNLAVAFANMMQSGMKYDQIMSFMPRMVEEAMMNANHMLEKMQ